MKNNAIVKSKSRLFYKNKYFYAAFYARDGYIKIFAAINNVSKALPDADLPHEGAF